MTLTGRWINKYEQYVHYIPDNSKVNKKCFVWTPLQSWGLWWGGKGIPQGDSTGRKELRVPEDQEKGRFKFNGWEKCKL